MKAYLCFGDSITFGRGENPSLGWVGRLKNDFESLDYYNAVYNLGIPGDTTRDLLKRIDTECRERIRVLREGDSFSVILAIGVNDSRGLGSVSSPDVSLAEFETNFESLLAVIKKYTSDITVLSLTPVDESLVCPYETTYFSNAVIVEYNAVLSRLSPKYIDVFTPFIARSDYCSLLDDGLHPNSAGYDFLYSLIKEEL